jgi:hypothetical protein
MIENKVTFTKTLIIAVALATALVTVGTVAAPIIQSTAAQTIDSPTTTGQADTCDTAGGGSQISKSCNQTSNNQVTESGGISVRTLCVHGQVEEVDQHFQEE